MAHALAVRWLPLLLLVACPPKDQDTAPVDTGEASHCVEDTGDTGETGHTDTPVDTGADTPVDTAPETGDSGSHTDPVDTGGPCPADMVLVDGQVCVDVYEASRPDATATNGGVDDSQALSVAGVIPWKVADNATAQAACEASGKRLCTSDEWYIACAGPEETTYSYGDTYDPVACPGGDAFCECPDGSHYQGCYYACGGSMSLQATGTWPTCVGPWGLFDITGNLWEHVQGGNDMTVRGGAYNCGDPASLHRCDYVPGDWSPSARGFRCCADPR